MWFHLSIKTEGILQTLKLIKTTAYYRHTVGQVLSSIRVPAFSYEFWFRTGISISFQQNTGYPAAVEFRIAYQDTSGEVFDDDLYIGTFYSKSGKPIIIDRPYDKKERLIVTEQDCSDELSKKCFLIVFVMAIHHDYYDRKYGFVDESLSSDGVHTAVTLGATYSKKKYSVLDLNYELLKNDEKWRCVVNKNYSYKMAIQQISNLSREEEPPSSRFQLKSLSDCGTGSGIQKIKRKSKEYYRCLPDSMKIMWLEEAVCP